MIIGNNNNQNSFTNQNFNVRMNAIKENEQKMKLNNQQNVNINTMQHSNILSKNEINERSFQMLQDRLNKGLITLDEFNKKCKDLSRR